MRSHDHFEKLSAGAVTGEVSQASLSAADWRELTEHWQECDECRELVDDVILALGPAFAELAQKRDPLRSPENATERFVARARSEGIPISKKPSSKKRESQSGYAVIAAIAIAATLTLILLLRVFLHAKPSEPEPVRISNASPAPDSVNAESLALRRAIELESEVDRLQSQLRAETAKAATEREKAKSEALFASELSRKIESLKSTKTELERKVADRNSELALTNTVKQADEIAIRAQEADVASLRKSVETLTEDLHRVQELSAADDDAKDLIGARNLHVVDVNDVNEQGKRQKPFGRVFYAEGQKLRFYAYDLEDRRHLDTKIQFYVWGERNGMTIKTLGVLHSDNAAADRWKLEFKDPQVLAKIDTLFVTIEKQQKPVTKPSGNRILYAILGDKANHP